MMTSLTPNEIGKNLEERTKKVLSGSRVPMSGGGKWWKCDVTDGGKFIWSCKATEKPYLRITKELIFEIRNAARGMRGTGDNYKGGLVVEIDGIPMVLTELDDFVDLVTKTTSERAYISPTAAQERRARARRSL